MTGAMFEEEMDETDQKCRECGEVGGEGGGVLQTVHLLGINTCMLVAAEEEADTTILCTIQASKT